MMGITLLIQADVNLNFCHLDQLSLISAIGFNRVGF